MDFAVTAIIVYLAAANAIAFAVYGIDKSRAKRGARRVPERTLLLLAFVGGGIGAFAGMLVFRHKTRKWRFRICVPVALALTLAVLGATLYVGDYYRADDDALAAAGETQTLAAVEVQQLKDGSLAFIPANPSAGLVFYPGGKVQPESYAPLMRQCAEQGILCVISKPLLNLAIIDRDAAQGVTDQFPEIDCWLLAGHSLGGAAASDYLARHEDEFDGIVFLAAYPFVNLSNFNGQVLSIVGTADGVMNRQSYEEHRADLPPDAQEYVIEGGNHAYFGNYGEQSGDGAATISRENQQALTARAIANLAERCA